jgi:hypothetical protein
MIKNTILAVVGLAMALTLASPSRASAGVIVGVGVGVGPVVAGSVFAPRPVFVASPAYGYVVVHRGPYFYPRPYAYAPAYVYPRFGYYHRFDRGWGRGYGYRGYAGRR